MDNDEVIGKDLEDETVDEELMADLGDDVLGDGDLDLDDDDLEEEEEE